jgi:hypothetical protein
MPEAKSLLSDVQRASAVGTASEQIAGSLPQLLDSEREALMAQLIRTLNVESGNLSSLASQMRSTLQTGTDTANALHAMLLTFQQITDRLAPKPGAAPPEKQGPQGPPFDIRQYTAALQQAASTAREINTLAEQTDAMLPVVRSATKDAADQLDRVLNRLFLLLALLVLVAAAAALLAAIAYRRIMFRFARSDAAKSRGL